jgi:hypothetical protein
MDALTYVQHHGVGLYISEGDRLKVYPSSRLDANLRLFIRDHRAAIIERLKTPDLRVTVGNILALAPHEVEELRAEIEAAPDDDPWIEFDREALQLAEVQLVKRRERMEAVA